MVRSNLFIGILAATCLAACGGSGGGGSTGVTNPPPGPTGGGNPPASTNQVALGESSFQPANITVTKGTTVTWSWPTCDDPGGYGYGYGSCVTHNILFDDGTTSGSQSTGAFTRTFATAGTYNYHCTIHGPAMSGQVIVQ
jgi:plastocyanin